jgi:hypothetical protein
MVENLTLMDLWKSDMGKVMKALFIDVPKSAALDGYLPKIAFCLRAYSPALITLEYLPITQSLLGRYSYVITLGGTQGSNGPFLASSFNKRNNSKANQKVTKGGVSFNPAVFSIPVVLSMIRSFMTFMRDHYPGVSSQHFKMTFIKLADSTVVEADDSH